MTKTRIKKIRKPYHLTIGNVSLDTYVMIEGSIVSDEDDHAAKLACLKAALSTGSNHPDIFRFGRQLLGYGRHDDDSNYNWLTPTNEEMTNFRETNHVPMRWLCILSDVVDSAISGLATPVPMVTVTRLIDD